MIDTQVKQDHDTLRNITDIFLKYRLLLRRVVGRIVKPHDIDDIVQETFLKIYEKARTQKINHPKTYLYTTARNLALNHIVKKFNVLEDSLGDFDLSNVLHSSETLESQIESNEKFLCFCRAIRELPSQCRRAFILKRIYGFSQKEIAAYLNISERTVEGHVANGITKCIQYLNRNGYPYHRNSRQPFRRKKAKETI